MGASRIYKYLPTAYPTTHLDQEALLLEPKGRTREAELQVAAGARKV